MRQNIVGAFKKNDNFVRQYFTRHRRRQRCSDQRSSVCPLHHGLQHLRHDDHLQRDQRQKDPRPEKRLHRALHQPHLLHHLDLHLHRTGLISCLSEGETATCCPPPPPFCLKGNAENFLCNWVLTWVREKLTHSSPVQYWFIFRHAWAYIHKRMARCHLD